MVFDNVAYLSGSVEKGAKTYSILKLLVAPSMGEQPITFCRTAVGNDDHFAEGGFVRKKGVSHIRWESRPLVRGVLKWANNVSRGKVDVRQMEIDAEFVPGGTIGPAPGGR